MGAYDDIQIHEHIKRKRRRAFFWGAGTALVLGGLAWGIFQSNSAYPSGPHIARVKIEGIILDDPYRQDMLTQLDENEDVRAVIIDIDSGGGAVYPSEQLYKSFRNIAGDVPVVAVMRSAAASGAYITALAAEHIIAGETTVTASIGVISEIPDISKALETVGIGTTVIRSSDSKGGISPLRTPTAEEIADEQVLINDIYDWFRTLVKERRGLTSNVLEKVASGGVVTGRQAVELDLIDALGGDREAIAYLVEQDASLEGLEIQDWSPEYPAEYLGEAVMSKFARAFVRAMRLEIENFSEPKLN